MSDKYCAKFNKDCPYLTPYGKCIREYGQSNGCNGKYEVDMYDVTQMQILTIKYLRTIMHQNQKILEQQKTSK